MKIIFDIELTPDGHKTHFSTEDYPTKDNREIDVVKFKGILLLAFENLAYKLLIPTDGSGTKLSKAFKEWLEKRKLKYGVK